MRICTYADPFHMKDNEPLWALVTEHPHFCASDTLVQGLEAAYGRLNFGHLRSVDALVSAFYREFADSPQNDIRFFLAVSERIRQMKQSPHAVERALEPAFRFNIASVVEAVKLLVVLQADPGSFDKKILSDEQKVLLSILESVRVSDAFAAFDRLKSLTFGDYVLAVRQTVLDELTYVFENRYADAGVKLPARTIGEGRQALEQLCAWLDDRLQRPPGADPDDIGRINGMKKARQRAGHMLRLLTDCDPRIFRKVIVHGVHRITPILYYLFHHLEQLGVEVVFLVNYCKNLPGIYQTWREVYSWCDAGFEYASDLQLEAGSKLGQAMAAVSQGISPPADLEFQLLKFKNLTSLANSEVATCFERADSRLDRMKTQYYAVRGKETNEILKVFFPQQFGSKQFLSYPIGQFILGVYSMWDFDCDKFRFSFPMLNECAAAGLYDGAPAARLAAILDAVSLYFSDAEWLPDIEARCENLLQAIQLADVNKNYQDLKMVSFFDLSREDMLLFRDFVRTISGIATTLFKGAGRNIDYSRHFRDLMNIISVRSNNNAMISETERSLIQELLGRLDEYQNGAVEGSINDVKDAVALYLAGKKKSLSSNWIVRDFEQIDGAVLLQQSDAESYHFALVSNENMTRQDNDALDWPLTSGMFCGYTDVESAIPAITRGILERRNFLKFTLFYGAFFTRKRIVISYIEEERGEKQSPYWLFSILGIEPEPYAEKKRRAFQVPPGDTPGAPAGLQHIGEEQREIFSICPFKFLMNAVVKAPIRYESDYHIKYYISNFAYFLYRRDPSVRQDGSPDEQLLDKLYAKLRLIFPFWDEAVLADMRSGTLQMIERGRMYPGPSRLFERRKRNFLIAQWKDQATGINCMPFRVAGDGELAEYMAGARLYPPADRAPHCKVCELCSFNDLCMRNYLAEVRADD